MPEAPLELMPGDLVCFCTSWLLKILVWTEPLVGIWDIDVIVLVLVVDGDGNDVCKKINRRVIVVVLVVWMENKDGLGS